MRTQDKCSGPTSGALRSLEELLEDYRDFLSVRDLPIWDKDSREVQYVRKLSKTTPLTFELFRDFTETRPAGTIANIAICLIHQANYLLDQQLKALGERFLTEGGLRERMTQARLQERERQRKGKVGASRLGRRPGAENRSGHSGSCRRL